MKYEPRAFRLNPKIAKKLDELARVAGLNKT